MLRRKRHKTDKFLSEKCDIWEVQGALGTRSGKERSQGSGLGIEVESISEVIFDLFLIIIANCFFRGVF